MEIIELQYLHQHLFKKLFDMIIEAFDVADLYRTPVMVLADGMIGQMMEPVDFDKERKN